MSPSDQSGPPPDGEWIRALALYARITAELVGLTGAGIAAGFYLDRVAGWGSGVIFGGGILGFVLAVVRLVQLGLREENSQPKDK